MPRWQLTRQKRYELIEERHASVATLGLRAAALLQEPQDHVGEAELIVSREAPGRIESVWELLTAAAAKRVAFKETTWPKRKKNWQKPWDASLRTGLIEAGGFLLDDSFQVVDGTATLLQCSCTRMEKGALHVVSDTFIFIKK